MKKITLMILALFGLCTFAVSALARGEDTAPANAPVPKKVEVDRNYDGLPDRLEYYNADGTVDRIETDTDFNGRTDEWVYYKNGIVEKAEKDTNGDGKPDTWMKY